MLVSDDESIVSRARFLSTQAREPRLTMSIMLLATTIE